MVRSFCSSCCVSLPRSSVCSESLGGEVGEEASPCSHALPSQASPATEPSGAPPLVSGVTHSGHTLPPAELGSSLAHLACSSTFSASQRPCSCSVSPTWARSRCSRALVVLPAAKRRLESRWRQAACRRWAVLAVSACMSARPLGTREPEDLGRLWARGHAARWERQPDHGATGHWGGPQVTQQQAPRAGPQGRRSKPLALWAQMTVTSTSRAIGVAQDRLLGGASKNWLGAGSSAQSGPALWPGHLLTPPVPACSSSPAAHPPPVQPGP